MIATIRARAPRASQGELCQVANRKKNGRKQRGTTRALSRKHQPVRSEADALVLFNQWTRLPYYIYRRLLASNTLGYPLSQLDEEDTVQEGKTALWRAALLWNSSQTKFITYASNAIQYQYLNLIKKRFRRGDHMQLQCEFRDTGFVPRSEVEDVERMDYLEALIDGFRSDVSQAVRMYYFHGLTLLQIREKMGVSYDRVRELIQHGTKRLKRFANEFGFVVPEIKDSDPEPVMKKPRSVALQHQKWSCPSCGAKGTASHERHVGVFEVVSLIDDAHRSATPSCTTNYRGLLLGWPVEAK